MRLLVFALLCCALRAMGAPLAMSDEELSDVSGGDGVGLFVHLELNSLLLTGAQDISRVSLGFNVGGTTTYAVLKDLGGIVDLYGITLDVRSRPDGGGNFLDIGLPLFVAFREFGFRALAAQTDPAAPIPPSASYGQLLVNGSANVTGHVYMWAAP